MRTILILITSLSSAACVSRSEQSLRTVSDAPCVPFGGHGEHQWLTGNFDVLPVAFEHQAEAMQRVKRGAVKSMDRSAAQAVAGKNELPKASYYYLVRVGYVGLKTPEALENISLGVDVDSEGVAYVSSFVLSTMSETSEAAAVLTSPTPLRRVVSTCGSAA